MLLHVGCVRGGDDDFDFGEPVEESPGPAWGWKAWSGCSPFRLCWERQVEAKNEQVFKGSGLRIGE